VRYPRGGGPGVPVEREMTALPIGKGEVRRPGSGVALLAFGWPLALALEVAETLDATVANMRFVKPLDEALVLDLASSHDLLVTLEENVVEGGAGSGVNELLQARGFTVPVLNIGMPDRLLEHGSQEEMREDAGFTVERILERIRLQLGEGQPRKQSRQA